MPEQTDSSTRSDVRDVHASVEIQLTDNVAYEKETPTAQLSLEPPQALSNPKLRVGLLDGEVELDLEDEHIDMLEEYVDFLRSLQMDKGQDDD